MIKYFHGERSSFLLFFLSMVSSSQDFVESALIADCSAEGSNNFLKINEVGFLWEEIKKKTTLITERNNVSPC